MSFVHGVVAMIRTNKKVKCNFFKRIIYCLVFPIYMMILLFTSVLALFVKVSWKKTPHNCDIAIDEI